MRNEISEYRQPCDEIRSKFLDPCLVRKAKGADIDFVEEFEVREKVPQQVFVETPDDKKIDCRWPELNEGDNRKLVLPEVSK